MRLPRRFDSLFVRLLLTQLAVVAVLVGVIGGLFYVERGNTIATLYADRWAGAMQQAAGLGNTQSTTQTLLRQTEEPAQTRGLPAFTLRAYALRKAFSRHGLPVDAVRLADPHGEPLVWFHIVVPQAPPVWLGVPGRSMLPAWPRRLLLMLVAIAALLVLASWSFTRRLTRPLQQLRQRMQALADSNGMAPHTEPSPLPPGSSPEIAAIDAAYTEAVGRLARHQRERAVLLAGVSHDLRSPLGRIRLAADLLPDTPDTVVRKESIVRNVAVADRLVESFLDYVRSDALAFDETVDLAALVRSVAARLEHGEALTVSAPATLPWPHANALMLERLISNLVDNAFKHGQAPVHIGLQMQPYAVGLEVTDAGPGIAVADVDSLQQAFSRGASSRTVPGTGLGLAIVRQIAQRLGGSVEFGGQPGAHWVRVTLPRRS